MTGHRSPRTADGEKCTQTAMDGPEVATAVTLEYA